MKLKPGDYFYWGEESGVRVLEVVVSQEEYLAAKGSIPQRKPHILCKTIVGTPGIPEGDMGYIETKHRKIHPIGNEKAFRILFGPK